MENGKLFSFSNITVPWLIWTVQHIFVRNVTKSAAAFYNVRPHFQLMMMIIIIIIIVIIITVIIIKAWVK